MEQNLTREFLEALETSDRAGALVAEEVHSVIRGAEAMAARIRADAEADAQRIVGRAIEAAGRVLAEIDALEGRLGDVVTSLRTEADRLSANRAEGS